MGMIEGVDRPALAMVVPSPKGRPTLVLDVGANVDSKPQYLRQFAVMGHSYAEQILGTENPRIGLLSIGEEEGKGSDLTREVFKIMESGSLNFAGNVEGSDVFAGTVDVIICDGFVGNAVPGDPWSRFVSAAACRRSRLCSVKAPLRTARSVPLKLQGLRLP